MHRPVVFVVAFALLSVAHGASISTTAPPYQGAITNFDDPGLWVGGVVPGPQSDVIIDTEWTVNILANTSIRSLSVSASALLLIEATKLTVANEIVLNYDGRLGLVSQDTTHATIQAETFECSGTVAGTGSFIVNSTTSSGCHLIALEWPSGEPLGHVGWMNFTGDFTIPEGVYLNDATSRFRIGYDTSNNNAHSTIEIQGKFSYNVTSTQYAYVTAVVYPTFHNGSSIALNWFKAGEIFTTTSKPFVSRVDSGEGYYTPLTTQDESVPQGDDPGSYNSGNLEMQDESGDYCNSQTGTGFTILFGFQGDSCPQCNSGWTFDMSGQCATPICPNSCSSKGVCNGDNSVQANTGVPLCFCNAGWTGSVCQTAICPGTPFCSGRGECEHTGSNVGVCHCIFGFSGLDCGTVGNVSDAYVSCVNSCGTRGDCTTEGMCSCHDGWSNNSTGCNIPRCLNDCSGNGRCDGSGSTPLCICDTNFSSEDCSVSDAAGVSLPIAVGVGVSAGVVGLAVIAAGVILGVKRLRTKVIPFRDREVNDPEQNSHRMAPMLPVGVQSETDQI